MANFFADIAQKFNILKPQEFIKEPTTRPIKEPSKKKIPFVSVAPELKKNFFSDIGDEYGMRKEITPLQTFLSRKKEFEAKAIPTTTEENWKRLGELTQELATFIPKAVSKVGLSLYQLPETLRTAKARKGVRVPKLLKPILGEEITSYARDVQDQVLAGANPVKSVLLNGAFATWDMAIVGSLLKGGVNLARKGVKVPETTHQAAWESMGRPATMAKAKVEYRGLAKTLHPDKPTGSTEAMSAVNDAYKILEIKGIPKVQPKPLRVIKDIADTLNTPVSELMKTKAGSQYFGLKGLLPEKAGFIPTEPFQEFRPARAGLSIEPKKLKPTSKELQPLAEEARKFKSAEEFIEFNAPRVFRGQSFGEKGIPKEGLSTTKDFNIANEYAKARGLGGVKKTYYLNPKAKSINIEDIPNEVRGLEEGSDFAGKAAIWARKQGYDILDMSKGNEFEVRILNDNALISKEQSKSQLTDIYNQAQVEPSELYDETLGRKPTLEEVIEEELPPEFWEEPQLTPKQEEAMLFEEVKLERTPVDDLISGYERIRIPKDTRKDWIETLGKGKLLKIETTDMTAQTADEFADAIGITENELLESINERFETRKKFKIEKVDKKVKQYTPAPKPIKIPIRKPVEPLKRLITAIKGAKLQLPAISEAHTQERARRAREVEIALQQGGERAYIQALGKLKGELIDRPKITGIRDKMTQQDIDELFLAIQKSPLLDVYEKISAQGGLGKIMEKVVPNKSELKLLEEVFGSELIKSILDQRGIWKKISENIWDILNWPRTLMTSLFDMSAVLRQGVIMTVSHPVIAKEAMKEMFKQAFSKKNFEKWLFEIKQTPEYKFSKKQGLYIADPTKISGGLAEKEERFMTNLLQKVPILGNIIEATERAYTSYLNKLRFDSYNQIAKKFQVEGIVDDKVYKSLADFVNNATGRGHLGKSLEKISPILNNVFFSPRLIAARFNFLNPIWYAKMPKQVRMEALKSFAEFVGVGITIIMLAKLGGAEVELDPRSSDFGKIKIGNSRWDIWGGFQQFVRVFTQLTTGQRKTTTKKEILELSKSQYPFETRGSVALRFAGGKLAPVASLITDILRGEKLFGEELSFSKEVAEKTLPLYLQDIKEAYDEFGASALLSVGIPGFFGVGTQTYKPTRSKPKGTPIGGLKGLEMPSLKMPSLKMNF